MVVNQVEKVDGSVALPAYLRRQQGGIFVDLSLFPVGGGFMQFIDRLFGDGMRFDGLNYRVLTDLLYDYDAILDAHGIDSKLQLAQDVVAFSPQRKALYRAVKIDADYQQAEYFFEPLSIEVVVEEPVYGTPDANGVAPVVSITRKVEVQPTQLDIDEFVADMWLEGIRFGIDVETLAGVFARGETGRMVIARQLDPTEGADAEIEEASEVLHRDNSPKILPDGKADLRKFQNRFPQIEAGARLLRKKVRVLGKPGYKVNGTIIEPEIPKDLDLHPLAGVGTLVEMQDGSEYIVAVRDGFLSLDVHNNSISVTEKIENKAGISIKTTGDLSLSGHEFIEHGEVQEGRIVEGKNMTFRSAVYGSIVSQGGFILLESNLSNGSAKSLGGDITSNGRAFNSVIEAWEGVVTIKYAESCVILAESVAIEHAVNCEIIADKISIDVVEGCAIAGKDIRVTSSGSCRGKQTVVSMLVPDLSKLDTQVLQVNKAVDDCKKIIEAKEQNIAQIKSDAEVARYLALATSIKQGTVKLTEAHKDNWQKMVARFAKVESVLSKLSDDVQEQRDKIQAFMQENAHLLEMREKYGAGVHCVLNEIVGDSMVRSMLAQNGISEFKKSKIGDIKAKLREQGQQQERIFSGSLGTLDWKYDLPELADMP